MVLSLNSGYLVVATGKCMSPTKYLQLFQISWGTTQGNNVAKLLEVVLEALYGEIPSKKALYGDIYRYLPYIVFT